MDHKYHKHSLTSTSILFVLWMAFVFMIADSPPPKGFWAVPVFLLALAVIIYFLTKHFLMNNKIPSWGGFFKNLGVWILVGALFGFVISFLPTPSRNPEVPKRFFDHIISAIMIGFFSGFSSFGYYFLNWITLKVFKEKNK